MVSGVTAPGIDPSMNALGTHERAWMPSRPAHTGICWVSLRLVVRSLSPSPFQDVEIEIKPRVWIAPADQAKLLRQAHGLKSDMSVLVLPCWSMPNF